MYLGIERRRFHSVAWLSILIFYAPRFLWYGGYVAGWFLISLALYSGLFSLYVHSTLRLMVLHAYRIYYCHCGAIGLFPNLLLYTFGRGTVRTSTWGTMHMVNWYCTSLCIVLSGIFCPDNAECCGMALIFPTECTGQCEKADLLRLVCHECLGMVDLRLTIAKMEPWNNAVKGSWIKQDWLTMSRLTADIRLRWCWVEIEIGPYVPQVGGMQDD